MILIINQHKGEFQELVDHLNNFIEKCTAPDKFHLALRIDQPTTDEEEVKIYELTEKYDNIFIRFGHKNVGLSPSREDIFKCYMDMISSKPSEYYPKAVIFGATNTKYTRELDDNLYEDLIASSSRITLLPCFYKEDPFERDQTYSLRDCLTFSEYINWEDKPDYSLMFPLRHFINCELSYDGESYYPEELIMQEIIERSLMDTASYELNIFPYTFIEAWYNENGLSKSFNRQFMKDNCKGFSQRAYTFLLEFDSEKFPLTLHRLKYFVYDYVTLSGEIEPYKQFNSDIIHSLCFHVLKRWISNPNHQHSLTFNERDE